MTYSEPVEVVEPTVVAALNMNYPGAKLAVHVLDDGCRREVAKMARRLSYQCRWVAAGGLVTRHLEQSFVLWWQGVLLRLCAAME